MKNAKTVIIETFNTNNFLITKALEGLSDDDFFNQPNKTTNPIHYLLGHITLYRYQGCQLLGNEATYPYKDIYAMGTKVEVKSVYPPAEAIKTEWEKVSEMLKPLLENALNEILSKEIPKKYPIGEQNVLGALQFLMFHETYHLGQISLVRRYFGYKGTIG